MPVKGLFQYDPAQFALNGSGNYVSNNPGAATIWFMENGTSYALSSDQNTSAVVNGNGGGTTTNFTIEIVGPPEPIPGTTETFGDPNAYVGLSYSGTLLPQLPTTLTGVNFTAGNFGYDQFSPYPNVDIPGTINVSSIGPLPSPIPSDQFGGLNCGSVLFTILCAVGATLVIGAVGYLCPPCVAG